MAAGVPSYTQEAIRREVNALNTRLKLASYSGNIDTFLSRLESGFNDILNNHIHNISGISKDELQILNNDFLAAKGEYEESVANGDTPEQQESKYQKWVLCSQKLDPFREATKPFQTAIDAAKAKDTFHK